MRNTGDVRVRGHRSLPLEIVTLALAAQVASGCTTAPSSMETIDVLDYVLGLPETWPRFGPTNHHQHQNLERNCVAWTKYTLGWSFERWCWDEAFIYHTVDHAIDGGTRRWEHYIFTDGRWMPRQLRVGETWTLDLLDNRLTWYDAACNPQPERPAPYRVRLWHEGLLDTGGDLGRRDVIVLAYQPNPAAAEPNTEERFYFAKGAGWYRWTRGTAEVTFNQIGGVARAPTPLCARDFQP
jgi:hypothetical protein